MGFVIISVVLLGLVAGLIVAHLAISRAVLRQADWGGGERLAALSASAFLLGTFWLAFGGLYLLIIDTQNPPIADPWHTILVFLASPPSYIFTDVRGINFFQCFYNGRGACDPLQFVGPALLTFVILLALSGLLALRQRRLNRT
ncbi:MAG: hypothetical protein DLM69_07190 [Candidatus Chloroheliales bacterium]|nr:MAG: hypothetical protein DLM69_07190 [Chloroflexota bacterium]